MKLRKCSECGEYNLEVVCRVCGKETREAHYKFLRLRDVGEIKKG
jgi:rRNA maturation protein Nop10